jgi:segregation and condensation protein B
MSERGVVEAALFSAGRALAVEEIAQTTGLSPDAVRSDLAALAGTYEERESAIEVVRIGEKWTMQIRASYGEKAHAFVPPELPKDLLKTSALIAYHQPLKQSDLVRMVGSKAYEHVKALADHGLITVRPLGQTLELRTSPSFPEFFGLPANDREELKRLLEARTGAPPPRPPSASTQLAPGTAPAAPEPNRT